MSELAVAVIVAAIGGGAGIVAALLTARATRQTAKVAEGAAVFEGYDELVQNLRAERDRAVETLQHERDRHRAELAEERKRLVADIEHQRAALAESERRCVACREQVAELLANLAALRAIIIDEIIRGDIDSVIGRVSDVTGVPAADIDADTLRDMLTRSYRDAT